MNSADQPGDEIPWKQTIYDQLHELAERALRREKVGHSMQPTMLVHDAYLQLMRQRNVDQEDRSQVLATGANIIRRLLVGYARKRKADRRGGAAGRGLPLHISVSDGAKSLDIIELNDALDALAGKNSRAAEIVELKFFGGLTGEEIAERLGVSLRTVNNDWRFAKAWLYDVLGPQDRNPEVDP